MFGMSLGGAPLREFRVRFHENAELFTKHACASILASVDGTLLVDDEIVSDCESKVAAEVEGRRMVLRCIWLLLTRAHARSAVALTQS